jgi:hypothetical protein
MPTAKLLASATRTHQYFTKAPFLGNKLKMGL